MKMWSVIKIIAVLIISCEGKTLKFSPRIINGREAYDNEFPYMVSIRRAELQYIFNEFYHICGGSILDEETVVTAAHCMFDPFGNPLTAPGSYIVGANFTKMWSDYAIVEEFQVSEVFIHPDYDPDILINDIAILKIRGKFDFTQNGMQPISIDFDQEFTEGTVCSVHGWGTLLSGYPLTPDILQTVDLQISNFSHCNETYDGIVTTNQVCAYETEKDSCSGDSGGAFVCNDLLYGIVSYGYGCAEPNIPGVYTKVISYKSFIENPGKRLSSSGERVGRVMVGVILMSVVSFFLI